MKQLFFPTSSVPAIHPRSHPPSEYRMGPAGTWIRQDRSIKTRKKFAGESAWTPVSPVMSNHDADGYRNAGGSR
jgi:hypothetical protein